MNREQLLETVWRENIKPDILACGIIKEGKQLQEECSRCDCCHICKEMIIGENEGE